MMGKKLRIGITAKSGKQIWSNGLGQNVHFLRKMLSTIDEFEVILVSEALSDEDLLGEKINLLTVELAKTLDLLLEVAYVVNDPYINAVKSNNGKVVSIKYGNNLITDIESIIFDKLDRRGITSPGRNDEIWISPHFNFSSEYLSVLSEAPVKTCPYIWDKEIFDSLAEKMKLNVNLQPDADLGIIGVFEPNINVLKTSLIPTTIIESFYRKNKDMLTHAYIFGADKLKINPRFVDIVSRFKTTNDHKISFESKMKTPFVFDRLYANTMVSHQWCNELNYLHLEAIHTGRPLIHNSPPFKEYGYYYEDFDVKGGASALKRAITTHKSQLKDQSNIGKEILWKYSIENYKNIRIYKDMIMDVIKK